MKASKLLDKMGNSLLGRIIWTEIYGEWPGGFVEITELTPDQNNAPEIVFTVKKIRGGAVIGVFDHEDVTLFTDNEFLVKMLRESENRVRVPKVIPF